MKIKELAERCEKTLKATCGSCDKCQYRRECEKCKSTLGRMNIFGIVEWVNNNWDVASPQEDYVDAFVKSK